MLVEATWPSIYSIGVTLYRSPTPNGATHKERTVPTGKSTHESSQVCNGQCFQHPKAIETAQPHPLRCFSWLSGLDWYALPSAVPSFVAKLVRNLGQAKMAGFQADSNTSSKYMGQPVQRKGTPSSHAKLGKLLVGTHELFKKHNLSGW